MYSYMQKQEDLIYKYLVHTPQTSFTNFLEKRKPSNERVLLILICFVYAATCYIQIITIVRNCVNVQIFVQKPYFDYRNIYVTSYRSLVL